MGAESDGALPFQGDYLQTSLRSQISAFETRVLVNSISTAPALLQLLLDLTAAGLNAMPQRKGLVG